MKKLNLLPPELQKQDEVNIKKIFTKALALTGVLLVILLLALGKYNLLALEKQLTQLEERRQNLLPFEQDRLNLEQQIAIAREKMAEYRRITLPEIHAADLIRQIGDITPLDCWFTRIELVQSTMETSDQDEPEEQVEQNTENNYYLEVVLEGYSETVNSVGLLSYYLNQQPLFKDTIVEYAEETLVNGVTLVEFRIRSTISESR